MSKEVDQRIVEMRFDNQQFEKNVSDSIKTIDRLKDSLNFNGVEKGFNNITNAAEKVDVSSIGAGIDAVKVKFSALQIMGATALSNLTTSAMTSAKKIYSALTSSIIEGGKKRALNIEQAKFQFEGLGINVEKAMASANAAVKGTAYGLDSAAKVASQLGASGMKAGKQMTKSLRAVSGVAAMTGDTYDNIGNIFTTVAGNGRLMSVQLLQISSRGLNAAAAIAKYFNRSKKSIDEFYAKYTSSAKKNDEVIKKGAKATEANIRTMVTNGAIDFQTFSDAMDYAFGKHAKDANKTFNGSLSNVKAALSRIGAEVASPSYTYFRDIFNSLIPIIDKVHEKMMPLIDDTNIFSKSISKKLIKSIKNINLNWMPDGIKIIKNLASSFLGVFGTIKSAFTDIFPPITAKKFNGIIKRLKDFSKQLIISEETSDKLRRTFRGLFAIADIGKQVLGALFNIIKPLFKGAKDLSGGFLDITASIGDWVVNLSKIIRSSELLKSTSKDVGNILGNICNFLRELFSLAKEKIVSPALENFNSFLNKVHKKVEELFSSSEKVKDGISNGIKGATEAIKSSGIGKVIEAIGSAINKLAHGVMDGFAEITANAIKSLKEMNFNFDDLLKLINSITLSGFMVWLSKFTSSLSVSSNKFNTIKGNISDLLNTIKGVLVQYQKQIKANVLKTIAVSIAILAGALLVLSLINPNKLESSIMALISLFFNLGAFIKFMSKLEDSKFEFTKITAFFLGISTSILILSSALKKLSVLSMDEVARGLTGIAGLATILVATAKALSSGENEKDIVIKGTLDMLTFVNALNVMTSICKRLAKLSWEELGRGISGLTALAGIIVGFSYAICGKKGQHIIEGATNMIIFGVALKIMCSACKDISKLSWEDLFKGILGLTALSEIVIGVSHLLDGKNTQEIIKSAFSMVIFATAVKILAGVVEKFGSFDSEKLNQGLTGVAVACSIIAVALQLMEGTLKSAAALVVMSIGLLILVPVLQALSSIDATKAATGLIVLAGALSIIAVALQLMEGTLKSAAALVVMSIGLLILVPVLQALSSLDVVGAAIGLTVLAGALGIIAVAGCLLTPVIGTLLKFSASLVIFSVSTFILASSIALVLTAMTLFIGTMITLSTVSKSAITVMSSAFVALSMAIAEAIPLWIEKIGEGIVGIVKIFGDSAEAIGLAFHKILVAIVNVMMEDVPLIVDGILVMLVKTLESLVQYTPKIVSLIFDLLIKIIDKLAEKIPELVVSVVKFLAKLFMSIADAVKELGPEALKKIFDGMIILSEIFALLTAIGVLAVGAMAGMLVMGLAIAELAGVLAAIGGLAQIPGLEWVINESADFLGIIGNAIGSFLGGIIGGTIGVSSKSLPSIGQNLSLFMTNVKPFIDGTKLIDPSVLNGVKSLAEIILLLTASSVIDSLTSWFTGGNNLASFGKELATFGPYFKTYYESVNGIDGQVIKSSANAAKALTEMANNLPARDGVLQFLAGQGDMINFAQGLASLGPAISKYGKSIKGIDPKIVKNSAIAALSLTKVANNLPARDGVLQFLAGQGDMIDFANGLVKLGPSIAKYGDSVKDIKADIVKKSSYAALSLSKMAKNLPEQNGVVEAWFGKKMTLVKFGEQLEKFGPSLATYTKSISDITPDKLNASANAGKLLAEMAKSLPSNGGVVEAWFVKQNTLVEFGKQLKNFAPHVVNYSKEISKISDISVVTKSASAGKALAEFAGALPAKEGVVQWWNGEVGSLSDFGAELEDFAPHLSEYYKKISNIKDASLITNSAASAKALAEFANNLPEQTDGLSNWLSGPNSLAIVGSKLAEFAPYLKLYSDNISGMNPDLVKKSAQAGEMLIGFANSLSSVTYTSISSNWMDIANEAFGVTDYGDRLQAFSQVINQIASVLTDFSENSKGIKVKILNEKVKAINSITDMLSNTQKINYGSVKTFNTSLANLSLDGVKNFVSGFSSKDTTDKVSKAVAILVNTATTATRSKKESLINSGNKMVLWIRQGVLSHKGIGLVLLIKTACEAIKSNKEVANQLDSAGEYVNKGFAKGIRKHKNLSKEAGEDMGKAALSGTKKALKINSPSKEFYDAGNYSGVAFVGAFYDWCSRVWDAGYTMGEQGLDGVNEAINNGSSFIFDDLSAQPTIKPVLDLSDVNAGDKVLSGMIDGWNRFSITGSTDLATSIYNSLARKEKDSNDTSSYDERFHAELLKAIKSKSSDIHNTFTINGENADDIAYKVVDILRKSVEREDAVWA